MNDDSTKSDRVQQALDNASEKKRDKMLRRGTRQTAHSAAVTGNESDVADAKKRRTAKSPKI